MRSNRRTGTQLGGDREADAMGATLGTDLSRSRRRRRMTQAQLAARVGCSRPWIGSLERGGGADAPLRTWVRLGIALGRPFAAGFSREIDPPAPVDAGHLAAQELLLRLARTHRRAGLFELPTKSADPSHSTDVGLRDDRQRVLILAEIWNRLDDVGRAARSSDRKRAEAETLAGFGEPPYRVASCWLFVDNAANRATVHRYPEILRARFPGKSVAWARAITEGGSPPAEPGLCWIDPRAGRITALRLR